MGDLRLDPEKGGLDKRPDLPLPSDDHSQDAGHDPADCDDSVVCSQGAAHCVTVAQSESPGKVDAHQIILLGPQIGGGAQVIVGGGGFCLADPAQDLFLGLRVDPDPELLFALYTCLGCDEPVDILSFTSRVGTDVDGIHLRIGQDPLYDAKLFFDTIDHLIPVAVRDERDRIHGPSLEGRIIGIRIGHGDQVTDTPCHDGVIRLHISVRTPEVFAQRCSKSARNAGLFSDKNGFRLVNLPASSC